jgi:hypothetical protein
MASQKQFLGLTPYDYKARYLPAMLTIAPSVLVAVLVFPALMHWKATVVSVFGVFGLSTLFAQLGRDRGSKLQAKLFERWGGAPTIRIFRFRDTPLDSVTHKRYLARMQALLPEAPKFTQKGELRNPDSADETYEAYGQLLREKTREVRKYELIFLENVNFGFRRNTLGLKGIALTALSANCLILAGAYFHFLPDANSERTQLLAGFAVELLGSIFWLVVVRQQWVRIPGEAYAWRLAEAIDTLK